MKLLTKALEKKLPPLGAQDGKGPEAVAYVKWFTPDAGWTWFCCELDPETGRCFGLVDGLETELGYWILSELHAITGPYGLGVERDMHWEPRTLEEIAPEMFKNWPRHEEESDEDTL